MAEHDEIAAFRETLSEMRRNLQAAVDGAARMHASLITLLTIIGQVEAAFAPPRFDPKRN